MDRSDKWMLPFRLAGSLKRFALGWARRLFIVLVVFVSLLTLFIVVTPQGRTGFHTALFVMQVMEVPFKPQSSFTDEPLRERITYDRPVGEGRADIYRVDDGSTRAGVLLFLGANAAGPDDEDVVNLGNALARAGFVTMFHWSPTMALQHNIDPSERENLVWAFQRLVEHDSVDPERVGMGGFCVGASFALVAAADGRVRDQVKFVNAFGPYFDAEELLLQVAARSSHYKGERIPWDPDQLTLKVVANELIETLEDPNDVESLSRVYLDGQPADAAAMKSLSEEGRGVSRLLDGATPEEARVLYDALPAWFREDIRTISPADYVDDISARLLVMHDQDDRLVPSVESLRLSEAFQGRGQVRYTELLAVDHVRPTSGDGIWVLAKEGGKLFMHMYSILRFAD